MFEESLKIQKPKELIDIASKRIVHALRHSDNSDTVTWALGYLHRSDRFESGQYDWNEFSETLECMKGLLSLNSLQFKTEDVEPELLSLALKGIFNREKRNSTFIDKLFSQNLTARNACLDVMYGPGDLSYDQNMLHRIEIKSFFRYIWTFVGKTVLHPKIISEILLLVPECIEETIINLALKDCKSLGKIKLNTKMDDLEAEEKGQESSDHDTIYLQYLHILKAASVSPQLFRMCTSIINQLLVLYVGCACCLSPFILLATIFVTEACKGRAWFYPTDIQTVAFLMEAEYKIGLESYTNDIQWQIMLINETQPPEVLVAIFSNFPVWLSALDPSFFLRL